MTCPQCGQPLPRPEVVRLYHYRESGLDNVYLKDITTYRCACGERVIKIPAVEHVHDAIAAELLSKSSLLTGAEFRFLRKWAGLTAPELASALGIKTRITISRWENDKARLTAAADRAIRLLVMRMKEDALNRRLFEHVTVAEQFRRIAPTARRFRITIASKDLNGAAAISPGRARRAKTA
ncbi:MAG: type II TA system antitoxin MqsA family protein [Nitrospirota bacterium]